MKHLKCQYSICFERQKNDNQLFRCRMFTFIEREFLKEVTTTNQLLLQNSETTNQSGTAQIAPPDDVAPLKGSKKFLEYAKGHYC